MSYLPSSYITSTSSGTTSTSCPYCGLLPGTGTCCGCYHLPLMPSGAITFPGTISITNTNNEWILVPGLLKLFEMLLQGKDPKKHKEEYLKEIESLTWVETNMHIMAVYQRLVKLSKALGI